MTWLNSAESSGSPPTSEELDVLPCEVGDAAGGWFAVRASARVEDVCPVREFPSYRGQRNYPACTGRRRWALTAATNSTRLLLMRPADLRELDLVRCVGSVETDHSCPSQLLRLRERRR